jgi:ABC-2 type transport system permease protein
MFWCYIFPILLATCFFFAFNNLWKIEDFKSVPIAYDSKGGEEDGLGQALEVAETPDGIRMFEVVRCDEAEAQQLLEEGKITAYIVGSTDPKLFIKDNGLKATIIKGFVDSYKQMSATIHTIMRQNPNAMNEGLLYDVTNYGSYIDEVTNEKKPARLLIYFYALLAFSCLYSASWGLDEVVNIQANLSNRGARVSVSPVRKMKLLLCNLTAALTAHAGSMILLFLYMYYIIRIDFGNHLFRLFLICVVGSMAGLALGAFVGVSINKKAETKEAILTTCLLGGAFLSGMMMPNMKYMIEKNLPILGYINPVNLITDAMYSLYYYDTYDRYFNNMAILVMFSVVLGTISVVRIRRSAYASI